jgi:hypothetical protein
LTTDQAVPTAPRVQRTRRRGNRRLLVYLALVALSGVFLAGCGTDTAELDSNGAGWWFAIHRNRTSVVFFVHIRICHSDYNCTLNTVKGQAATAPAQLTAFLGVDFFFDDDLDDFRDALDSTRRPVPADDINQAAAYGCLGGYREWPDATNLFRPDGDWRADNDGSQCILGA